MNFQQKFAIISTILALPILTLSQDSPPLVCNDFGNCFQGSWMEAKSIATFQGIRYAQPPIGELRFKNPIPINQQEGTIDASEISTIKCTQIGFLSGNVLLGQEDCLLLNIYVPESVLNNPEKKLPVIFWIHGGGLTFRIIIDIGCFDKITIRFGHIIILITFFLVASYWRRNGTKMEIKSISCPRSFLILKKTHVSSFKRNAVLANAINLASVSVHQPPNSIFGYDRFVTFLIAQTFHFHPIKIFDV